MDYEYIVTDYNTITKYSDDFTIVLPANADAVYTFDSGYPYGSSRIRLFIESMTGSTILNYEAPSVPSSMFMATLKTHNVVSYESITDSITIYIDELIYYVWVTRLGLDIEDFTSEPFKIKMSAIVGTSYATMTPLQTETLYSESPNIDPSTYYEVASLEEIDSPITTLIQIIPTIIMVTVVVVIAIYLKED